MQSQQNKKSPRYMVTRFSSQPKMALLQYKKGSIPIVSNLCFQYGAGEGNRTLIISLEG
jgi:hypothetical protein